MSTGTLAPIGKVQYFSDAGAPLSGGKLYTYAAGTTTAATTYSDSGLTTPNANPIVLDSAGRATIFLPASSFKFILKTSADVTVWTQDNISAVPTASGNLDFTGTAGEALNANDNVYLSDGSGGKTAGRWYQADADFTYASSLALRTGFATAAIASGASGTIRVSGQIELSGLVAGTTYYTSATAGAVTSTAPTNARRVGVAQSTTTLDIVDDPSGLTGVLLTLNNAICEGRLTLTTGTPVTTSDVTAATTVYFAPYRGNRIALYDGVSLWNIRTFSQLSIAVPATTSTIYDVWVYDNSGTPTLEVLAWTSDTARATALTTQDGVLVKTGATTRRYVGSFRTTGVSGQTEDSLAKRYVWNYYNRVLTPLKVTEGTNTWNYNTATWRQMNNSAANQVDIVQGWPEDAIEVWEGIETGNNTGGWQAYIAIGEDSATTPLPETGATTVGLGATYVQLNSKTLSKVPAVGRHYYAALEKAENVGAQVWVGDNGGTDYIAGIFGTWMR